MYTKRAEFKAGLVVLLALAALLTLVYLAGGSEPIWGDYRYVHVRFEQSFTAPSVGDLAYMNGVGVGRVAEVHQREEVRGEGTDVPLTREDRRRLKIAEDASGTVRELYVVAVIKMPAGQRLPRGTTAQVGKSLTGIRELWLLPGLEREDLTDAMTRADPIPGRQAPGLSGLTERLNTLAEKLEDFVGAGTEVMAEARSLLKDARGKLEAFRTQEMDRDARAALAALRDAVENAEKKIGRVTENLEAASAHVRDMAAKGSATMDALSVDVDKITEHVKSAVARIDEIVKGAEGPVREILANLQAAGHDVRQATQGIVGLGPAAQRVVTDLGLDLRTLSRNLNDTAHNLLDASEDLRTHPWKLLNKPDEGEIAYANLRNASQSYMRAMRDVNEASARLFQLLGRPDADSPEIRPLLRKATQALEASLDGYRSSEERFLRLFRSASAAR